VSEASETQVTVPPEEIFFREGPAAASRSFFLERLAGRFRPRMPKSLDLAVSNASLHPAVPGQRAMRQACFRYASRVSEGNHKLDYWWVVPRICCPHPREWTTRCKVAPDHASLA
jgi:hypothetical protein